MESLRFLSEEQARTLASTVGTPLYVYDEATLRQRAREALAFPHASGLAVRFAIKANPSRAILQILDEMGLRFDASSGFEARRAMLAGIDASKISISSQELPKDFQDLAGKGVHFNLTSLSQIETFGKALPGSEIGVRFNPGIGSGETGKTTTGGRTASFGIWFEKLDAVKQCASRYGLRITGLHSHIGSGGNPEAWEKAARANLDIVRQLPDVETVDLGGGFKVGRMSGEKTTVLQPVGLAVKKAFEEFQAETGRALKLEIEPGAYLTVQMGAILSSVIDIVDTGPEQGGYRFIKLDTGMTDILRPSLYAAQHPIIIVPGSGTRGDRPTERFVVTGHCCESGDLLTPGVDSGETLGPRELTQPEIGDLCVIEGSGAYCAAMSAKNYNSFPESAEVLLREDGTHVVIRQRQQLEQIVANEVSLL